MEEDYTEEEFEKRKAEFPKVVKYYTDDEEESYYIKEKQLWVEEDFFKSNGSLLITLSEAYLKCKGIEKGTMEYIEKFEGIVELYV